MSWGHQGDSGDERLTKVTWALLQKKGWLCLVYLILQQEHLWGRGWGGGEGSSYMFLASQPGNVIPLSLKGFLHRLWGGVRWGFLIRHARIEYQSCLLSGTVTCGCWDVALAGISQASRGDNPP